MKLRLATLSLVLVGASAFAQTNPVLPRLSITRVDAPNIDTFTFGGASCNESITLRWQNTLTYQIGTSCNYGSALKLWATPGTTCQDAPGSSDLVFTDVPVLTVDQLRQGTFSLKISDLPDFKNSTSADGGTLDTCGSPNPFTRQHVVCGVIDYSVQAGFGCGTATKLRAVPLKLIYDTLPPGKPTITAFTAQDQAVRVEFSIDSDTTTVILEAQGPTDIDFVNRGETASTSTFIRGENLQNAVPYKVQLRALDAAGNVSAPSDPIEVTPIRTVGFWGYYKDMGGTDAPGCSTGLGLSPLLLIALALRRARKRGE